MHTRFHWREAGPRNVFIIYSTLDLELSFETYCLQCGDYRATVMAITVTAPPIIDCISRLSNISPTSTEGRLPRSTGMLTVFLLFVFNFCFEF
jgi:hypothetical protein